MPRRAAVAVALLGIPLLGGCGHYAGNRFRDLGDPWHLGVEALYIPANLAVQATILDTGLGAVWGGHSGSTGWVDLGPYFGDGFGFLGRAGFCHYYPWELHIVFAGVREVRLDRTSEDNATERIRYMGFLDVRLLQAPNPGAIAFVPAWGSDAANLEVSAGILLGARAGVNLLQVFDFFAGLATLDVLQDDATDHHLTWRTAGGIGDSAMIEYFLDGKSLGTGNPGFWALWNAVWKMPRGSSVRLSFPEGSSKNPPPFDVGGLRFVAEKVGVGIVIPRGE